MKFDPALKMSPAAQNVKKKKKKKQLKFCSVYFLTITLNSDIMRFSDISVMRDLERAAGSVYIM